MAAFTLLSLAFIGWRVHRKGRFGQKSGAVVRSVWAAALGLGGWVIGVLTVVILWPGLPIDDQLLVVFSVGLPVALAAFFGWVRRDWTARTRHIGLAVATAGSLAGAWLGFHATSQVVAIVTTTAGAVAGANLALILFDIVRAGGPAPSGSADPLEASDDHDPVPVLIG